MDIQFYDRLIYRPEYNYSFAYYQNRIDQLICSYPTDDWGTLPDNIIELHDAMLYITDLANETSISEQQKTSYYAHIPKIKQRIAVYFSKITAENILLTAKSVHPQFAFRFWELICHYKKSEIIDPDSFKEFLLQNPLHLDDILAQKELAKKYSSVLYNCFAEMPKRISILISSLLSKREITAKKLYIKEALSAKQLNSLFRQYIQLEVPNVNLIRLVAISQNNNEIGLDDEIRLLAQRKEAALSEDILETGSKNEYGLSVSFEPCNEWKHYSTEDRNFSAVYDSRWISENLDYPTLLDNFIHWFEYADCQCRSNLPLQKNRISAIEDMTIVKGLKTYDAGYGFKMTHFLHLITMQGYYGQLKKYGVILENVFTWFFSEYLPTEFSIDKFIYNAPTPEASYLEKCKLIAGEIEGVLKQFILFQKYGCIDRGLVEISSEHLYFRNIPSLLSTKYLYAKGDLIKRCIYYLFDDCMLGYFSDNEYENFDSLYEAMMKYKQIPTNLLSLNYHKSPIQSLLELGVLIEVEENYRLDPQKSKLLLELHEKDVICYHHCESLQNTISDFIDKGYLSVDSTLFSIPEQEYLDYILNKASFTNGLDLRNKYVHGIKAKDDCENFNDYLEFLLIMVMIIIKINDELCLKYQSW